MIVLSKAFDTRTKSLNLIYFVSFTITGLLFLNMATQISPVTFGLVIFITIVVGVYLFVGYRFINKALQTERLIVSKTKLPIEKNGFLTNSISSYSISDISNLRYLKLPEVTKHPLAGETFDYLGFQTEQLVINEMHGDNRIAFEYGNKTITFGENLYSWDFDEIERLLQEVTGNFQLSTVLKKKLE